MSRSRCLCLAALIGLAFTAGLAFAVAPPLPAEPEPALQTSAAQTHENLTIFFLHGEDEIESRTKILTLDEAMKEKKVIVHETQNVNQLAIENISKDEDVFVQAGDIVKGGQQDRIIALDLLLPPKSGRLPIASFCVEQGRWTARPGEDRAKFNRSGDALVSNDQKLAARKAKDQRKVWQGVAGTQKALAANLKAKVTSKASATSLGLTLENEKVLQAADAYVKKLLGSLERCTDVIGYAAAINGKVNNADVYGSAALFRKLWPKLLKCSAVEAAARKSAASFAPVRHEAVTAFLRAAARGAKTEKKTVRQQREVQRESANNVLFETRVQSGIVLRRSYVAK
jgi:hypothetical protein